MKFVNFQKESYLLKLINVNNTIHMQSSRKVKKWMTNTYFYGNEIEYFDCFYTNLSLFATPVGMLLLWSNDWIFVPLK